MATMQGITGKLSGKMGSAVFRVRDGQQVVTQYNPVVKNPNTRGQQTQRAAFKLMSQLSAIMAIGFGTMIVNKRKAKGGAPSQRNAFVQINFPLVTVTTEDQEVRATIPMEQLKLTSSHRPLPPLTVRSQNNRISLTMVNISPEVSTLRVVVVGYPLNVASVDSIRDLPVGSDGTVSTDVTVSSSGNYTVLAYGLIPSESAKSSINIDNIHTPQDEEFISAVELNEMVARGDLLETQTVGANISVSA